MKRKHVSFREEWNVYYIDYRNPIDCSMIWYNEEDYYGFKLDTFRSIEIALISREEGGGVLEESATQTLRHLHDYCYHPKTHIVKWSTHHVTDKLVDLVETMRHHYGTRPEILLGIERFIERRILINSNELRHCLLAIIQDFQNEDGFTNKYMQAAEICLASEEASEPSKRFAHALAVSLEIE